MKKNKNKIIIFSADICKLYGNWIKILGLNQVKKEKKQQRRQHFEDVRNQRKGEKALTEDEKETCDPKKESEEKTQRSKVVTPRKNEDKLSN